MKKKRETGKPEEEQDQTAQDDQKGEEPEGAAQGEAPENKKDQAKSESKQKELTQEEVLKLYLQKAMERVKQLEGELEEQKKQLEQAKSAQAQVQAKLSSVVAEYDNYRRRTTEEKAKLSADAIAKAVGALLPALDSLEKASEYKDANPESYRKGVGMTLRQLENGFKTLGVEEIKTEQGEPFDPDRHNAVMHVQDETLGESVITDVFQKGYQIGDKVIRHSVVKVAN